MQQHTQKRQQAALAFREPLKLNRYDIRVAYDPPPIPTWAQHAYHAWSNEYPEEFGMESGASVSEAVAALMEKIEGREQS
jgi:hypothetical protein